LFKYPAERARGAKPLAYGILTAKFLGVLDALLWSFHNGENGRCVRAFGYPSPT
jgi:hypothetical protein